MIGFAGHIISINFFIKTLKIMFIFTNIHRPYVCNPLGLYISLVNNSLDPIKLYLSMLISYSHQHKTMQKLYSQT